VHRFYQEPYQIDGGADRYVAGSDAVGLAMGVYDTRFAADLQYLHGAGAPRYAIADTSPGRVRRLVPQPPVLIAATHGVRRERSLTAAPTICTRWWSRR